MAGFSVLAKTKGGQSAALNKMKYTLFSYLKKTAYNQPANIVKVFILIIQKPR